MVTTLQTALKICSIGLSGRPERLWEFAPSVEAHARLTLLPPHRNQRDNESPPAFEVLSGKFRCLAVSATRPGSALAWSFRRQRRLRPTPCPNKKEHPDASSGQARVSTKSHQSQRQPLRAREEGKSQEEHQGGGAAQGDDTPCRKRRTEHFELVPLHGKCKREECRKT